MRVLKSVAVIVVLGLCVASLVGHASAQPYPNREIHVICGYPAGTGPDIATRYVANMIQRGSGATVIVDGAV